MPILDTWAAHLIGTLPLKMHWVFAIKKPARRKEARVLNR